MVTMALSLWACSSSAHHSESARYPGSVNTEKQQRAGIPVQDAQWPNFLPGGPTTPQALDVWVSGEHLRADP